MIAPIFISIVLYGLVGMMVAAFLLDEAKEADNYQFLGIGILWPFFVIKGIVILIKFIVKNVVEIIGEIHWTKGPMAVYKIFKQGFKSLFFGIETYDWAGQSRAYHGGIREICAKDDIKWNDVEKNYTFDKETWEWINNENGSRYAIQG